MTDDLSSTFGEPATSRLRGLLPPRREPDGTAGSDRPGVPGDVGEGAATARNGTTRSRSGSASRTPHVTGPDPTNRRWGVARVPAREHVDLLVLCALRRGPASGRGIAQRLRADSDGALAAPERTVHATLHRLARNRLLRRTGAGEGVGPHYALTEVGRRVLSSRVREWQALARAVDRVIESGPTP